MSKTVIGLEITEEGVRAAEVTAGRTPALVAYGAVPLPVGAARDSEVLDPDAVALALRQLWTRGRFSHRRVVLGIGSRRILVREYTTQALRPDLLRQALPFQVQDLLPVPADQAVLDFYASSQEGDQITGLLVAAVAETVEQLVTAVGKAKLTVDTVDLAPFGLARGVSRLAAPGESVAALHLGDHTSYVVIVRDGVPRFVRILPLEILTDAVREREAAAAPAAEETEAPVEELVGVGAGSGAPRRRRYSSSRGERVAGMTEAALSDLVGRMRSTLAFYAGRTNDVPVSRVILTGAGASAPEVGESLAASLPLPVAYAGAAEIIAMKTEAPQGTVGLDLLTTVGLALIEGR
ncbi:pilus assembly protein PilM [Microbacterium sp. CFH 31415]|uniref:type IV pilus biogenesis protein PilM n=1 Tax=Microbacterium sp. CFH 31415 TaxID=2921732 RepID=UPI001F1381E9|nr:pilus assembly protein PilM [Microbacterium sp. CFH 31415]MCH6229853.1 pilus assembly protein PilM [Microbacterium sp. CFH 31415]